MKRTVLTLSIVAIVLALITFSRMSGALVLRVQDSSTDRLARIKAAQEALAHPFDDVTGKTATDFTLHTIDNKVIQIANFRGRPLLLSFFRLKECPPCLDQLSVLSKVEEKYRKTKLAVIALVQERAGLETSRDDIDKALKALGSKYPVAYAVPEMKEAYGKNKIVPYNVYVSTSGKIFHQAAGQSVELMDQTVHQLLETK